VSRCFTLHLFEVSMKHLLSTLLLHSCSSQSSFQQSSVLSKLAQYIIQRMLSFQHAVERTAPWSWLVARKVDQVH
jgi:hypothetical protein